MKKLTNSFINEEKNDQKKKKKHNDRRVPIDD